MTRSFVAVLAVGMIAILAQSASFSPPKSLGYQSAKISGFEFDAGRFSATSYVTVELQGGTQAKIAVDASFSPPKVGQSVCIHSATQWLTTTPTYRFARMQKCIG